MMASGDAKRNIAGEAIINVVMVLREHIEKAWEQLFELTRGSRKIQLNPASWKTDPVNQRWRGYSGSYVIKLT